jgi:hypothetical protein
VLVLAKVNLQQRPSCLMLQEALLQKQQCPVGEHSMAEAAGSIAIVDLNVLYGYTDSMQSFGTVHIALQPARLHVQAGSKPSRVQLVA